MLKLLTFTATLCAIYLVDAYPMDAAIARAAVDLQKDLGAETVAAADGAEDLKGSETFGFGYYPGNAFGGGYGDAGYGGYGGYGYGDSRWGYGGYHKYGRSYGGGGYYRRPIFYPVFG